MKQNLDMTKEEVEARLKKIQNERDTMAEQQRDIHKQWQENMESAGKRYWDLEEMISQCGPFDSKTRGYIEENQSILKGIKRTEGEYQEMLKDSLRKKQMQLDMEEEELYLQVMQLEEQNENGGTNHECK